MSRVFWDSMLFIYLVEDHPTYFERCVTLLERSYERGDTLYTSYLVLGEVLAGAQKSFSPGKARAIRETAAEMKFNFLPFDEGAVEPFAYLRAGLRLQVADSVNLACAASSGMDLFLTNDKRLARVTVTGIQFIADFQASIL